LRWGEAQFGVNAVNIRKIRRKEGIRMRGNTKHLVFCVCVAFVLLCAFVGVSVASARTISQAIFDTGSPRNPYPSIMGTHKGTIKPNHTIIATKLYTYPCAGTGGHTEYARIWNKTWSANATWEGYAGEWHNITFDKTVVLLAGETYNYTIRTGSYPQIHHTDALKTAHGWINCTEFVDANGNKYNDWIPAIRLFREEFSINISATSPHVAMGDDDFSIVTVTAKDDKGDPVVGADIVIIKKNR